MQVSPAARGRRAMDGSLLFTTDTFTWGLEGICRVQRAPFAPDLLLQQMPPPYDVAAFERAAQALGIRAGRRAASPADLATLPTPYLAVLNPRAKTEPGAANATPDAPSPLPLRNHRLALILRCDGERASVVEEGSSEATTISRADLEREFSGTVVLFAPAPAAVEPAVADPEAAAARFGFRWFVPELLRHKRIWRDVLLASVAIQLMGLAMPIFTQVVIDKVIVHYAVSTLLVIAVALAVIIAFTASMNWVRQYLVLHTGNRIDAVLGQQVVEHLFRLPPRFFEQRPTGTLVARVYAAETIREFLSGAAITLVLDVALTVIALAILAAIVGLSAAVAPLLRARLNEQFLMGARNQAFLTEYVAGMETVKSLQMEPQLVGRFGDYRASYLGTAFRTRQLSNSYNTMANALEQFLMLAILCVGAWMVMNSQDLTIGMLVAFQMFAGRLAAPLLRIVGLWQEFQQASIAVARLGDVMNAPAEPYSLAPAHETRSAGAIEITNLGFRYGENLPYLYRDFSLAIPAGQCVALMGPSACGKSTMVKLLLGFYLPTDGCVLLDGRDVRHYSANELRQRFGVVPQETVLFSGTVYDNLVLANPHATFEEVVKACRLAEIHGEIERLPHGYQTHIGEH
ncbi:MAG: peptidase domain-containing ABC transporter, partial [Betaproteobacteria bacterium]|nr:peptidase domain-containing ABC transporter [Betaproteobacteria bacterium]